MCCRKKQTELKKPKKPQQPNSERWFYSRKYQAFKPSLIGIQVILTLSFIVLNAIAMVKYVQRQKEFEKAKEENPNLQQSQFNQYEDGNDFDKALPLIDIILGNTHEGIFKLNDKHGYYQNCKICKKLQTYFDEEYKEKVKEILERQNNLFVFERVNQILILYPNILSLVIFLIVFFKSKIIFDEIYLEFMDLVAIELNIDIYLAHALKYSPIFKGKCEVLKPKIILIKNLLISIVVLAMFFQLIFGVLLQCSTHGGAGDESNKLLGYIKEALKEQNLEEDQLFRIDMIYSVEVIRDSLTSCSPKSVMKYLYQDFWRIYTQVMFIIKIKEAFEAVYAVFNRREAVNYYRRDDNDNLIPEPLNELEDEIIPLTKEVQLQNIYRKQNPQLNTDQQKLYTIQLNQQNQNTYSPINQVNSLQTLNNLPNTNTYPVSFQSSQPQVFIQSQPGTIILPNTQGQQFAPVFVQQQQPVYYYYTGQVQQGAPPQQRP